MNTPILTHKGIITAINGSKVDVEVQRDSACGNCTEKHSCAMNESGSVNIQMAYKEGLEVGDMVLVEIRKKQFYRSVFLVYVNPIIIMLITALSLHFAGAEEIITACSTLAAPFIYFAVLKQYLKNKDNKHYILKRKV